MAPSTYFNGTNTAFTFSVTGTGYVAGASASLVPRAGGSNVPLTVSAVTATSLSATLPARAIGNRVIPGQYDLVVTVFGSSSTPDQNSLVTVTDDHPDNSPGAPELGENDTLTPGSTLTATEVINGELGYSGDNDIFQFSASSGLVYRIEVCVLGACDMPANQLTVGIVSGAEFISSRTGVIFVRARADTVRFFVAGNPASTTGRYAVDVFLEPPSITFINPTTALNSGNFDIDLYHDASLDPYGVFGPVGLCRLRREDAIVVTIEDTSFPTSNMEDRLRATGTVVSESCDLVKVRFGPIGLGNRPKEHRIPDRTPAGNRCRAPFPFAGQPPECGNQIFISVGSNKSSTGPSTVMTFVDDHPHPDTDQLLGTNPAIKQVPSNPADVVPRNSSVTASMDYGGDRDAFILKPERNKIFTVLVAGLTDALDMTLEVREPPTSSHPSTYQTTLCTDDIHPAEIIVTSPRNQTARATFITTFEQDYHLIVDGFGTGACVDPVTGQPVPRNTFTITAPYTISVAQDEHPTCPEDTMPRYDLKTSDGVATRGELNFFGDVDSVQFDAKKGRTYVIEVREPGDSIPIFDVNLYGKLGTCSGSNLVATSSAAVARVTTTAFDREFHKIQISGRTSPVDNYPLTYQVKIIEGFVPVVASVTPTANVTNDRAATFTITGSSLAGPGFTRVELLDNRSLPVASLTTTSVTSTSVVAILNPGGVGNKLRPGTYAVRVTTDFGSSVLVSQAQVQVIDDYFDSFSAIAAAPSRPSDQLTSGVFKVAEIGYARDADFFAFPARANTQYVVEAGPGDVSPLATSTIQIIGFLGGPPLQSGISTAPVVYVATEATAPSAPTTHFIRIAGLNDVTTGRFRVRFQEIPVPIVTAVSPKRPGRGSNAGDVPLTISGLHFLSPAKVTTARLDDSDSTALEAPSVLSDLSFTTRFLPRPIGSHFVPGSYHVLPRNGAGEGPPLSGGLVTFEDDRPEVLNAVGSVDQIPVGGVLQANLGFRSDVDSFFFGPVANGQSFQIVCTSTAASSLMLSLFGPTQAPLASVVAASRQRLAYTATDATAGTTNYLQLAGASSNITGTYSVTVVRDDHPDTVSALEFIARAEDLLPNATVVQASIDTTGDVDLFKFATLSGSGYRVRVEPSGASAAPSVSVRLRGPAGTISSALVTSQTRAELTTTANQASEPTNYVEISSSGTGGYIVSVVAVSLPAVLAVAPAVPLLNASSTVLTVTHRNADPALGVEVVDAGLRRTSIPGSAVQPLDADTFTFTLPAREPPFIYQPPTGFVIVRNSEGESAQEAGATLRFVDDHPESASALSVGDVLLVGSQTSTAAALGFPGDVDFFRFSAIANVAYTIEVQRGPTGNIGNAVIQAFSGSAQLNAPSSSSGNSTFATVSASQGGEIVLGIAAQSSSHSGSYSVRVFEARRPTVISVSPSRGIRDAPTPIAVSGQGFLGASRVRLSDAAATLLSTPVVSSDASMRTTVPAGVVPGLYDVLVTNALGVSASGTGKFQVDDHPNVFATLGPDAIRSPRDDLQVNQPAITGTLETPIDRDLYAFQVTLGHTYTVQTNLLTLSDTALTILGSDGATIVGQNEDIDAGRGLFNSQVVFQAGETATFYARVETSNTGSGTYGLAVSDPLAPDDHSNSAAQLNPATDNLAERLAMAGAINYSGDVDFFAFTALRGSVYDVETALGTLSDTVLTLFDRDGVTRLAENDDNPDNVTSRASKLIGFQPAVAGTYFLKVRHLASDPESTGSYTLTFTRRDGSLAVTAVRASQASVSRGQVATLLIDLENTGLHRLTALSGGFDIRAGASSRIADYTLTPDSANVTEFFPGQTATLGFTARVAAGAALGPVRIDARASGLDSGTTISDAASFTTTTWTVQSPAAISIASFVAPVQVSRGQSVTVTMNLDNSGQAEATIDSLSLKLSGTGGVSRDLEYVVTAAPGNPTAVAGIPAGSTARSVRTPVRFLVTVRADATLEAITIDGTFRGRDANSLAALSDDTAATKAQWAVQTAASLFIRSVVGPSAVSQGQTTQVVMNLENPGQSSVTLQSAALRFIDGLGNDLTASDYVVSPLPGNPTTLAARGKAALRFSVFVASGAARTRVVVDGSAFGRDDRTSNPITLIRAEIPAEWIVQRAAALSILALGVSPAVVSRGGTIAITMSVSNPGEADALLSAAGLRFFAASGGAERTAEYRVTASAGNASVVRGEATTTLAFSVTALASASIGINRVEGSVSGFDRNTASSVSAVSNANVSPFFRLSNVFVTIARPQSSDLLFFDEPIAFEGNAVDDLGAPFPGANLAWRSDVSGGFGSGTAFTASLPAATHRVTVTATAGSGITSSVETTLVVRPAPAPIGLLSVSGTLSREATGSPLGRGFEVRLENRARSTIATYVTTDSTGRYTALLLSATGAAAGAGDLVTATIREPGGLQRPTSPASFALRSRDIALGSRLQNLSAADLLETLLTLRRGLNLVGLPLRPATTSGPDFTAADLATFTGSSFVSRVSGEPAAGRGRFEAFVPGQGGAFAIQGNEGYLLHSPLDQTLSLRGSPWAPALLFRQLSKGLNLVALPLGVPPGFDSAQLLGRAPGASFLAELNPQDSGVSRFDVFVPGLSLPVPILDGKGYVLSVPAGGDLLLPAAP